MGYFRRILVACAITACAVLLSATSAFATAMDGPIEQRSLPTPVTASFNGWGYTIGTGLGVTAYRWSTTGWIATTLPVGAGVRVYPFGSGWSWAGRSGAWYAVRTASLAQWNCASLSAFSTTSVFGDVRQYPTSTSRILVYSWGGTVAAPEGTAPPPAMMSWSRLCADEIQAADGVQHQTCGSAPGGPVWCSTPYRLKYVLVRAYANGQSITGYVEWRGTP